jgi:tetratricopeptide (TPR) repeat protein
LDFTHAAAEYQRALALAPSNARVVIAYGHFASMMGQRDAGLAAARRAVALDPLNPLAYSYLGDALMLARQYGEALAAQRHAVSLAQQDPVVQGDLWTPLYLLGDFQSARATCDKYADLNSRDMCLAMSYERLGRHADAEAMLSMLQTRGDTAAYDYATIYAQWGDIPHALGSLDTAMRRRDPGLVNLKMDPFLDPLRNEPRFQAIERALKFPE